MPDKYLHQRINFIIKQKKLWTGVKFTVFFNGRHGWDEGRKEGLSQKSLNQSAGKIIFLNRVLVSRILLMIAKFTRLLQEKEDKKGPRSMESCEEARGLPAESG